MVSIMRNILKELSFYQKDPLFFDAIFEAHLLNFKQNEISSFEIVLYHPPNIHLETWRLSTQNNFELLSNESSEIKRMSHLGNRLTFPISIEDTRIIFIDHSLTHKMGFGSKETWRLINNKWVCLESKKTWIG
jgi:hypothetical protein